MAGVYIRGAKLPYACVDCFMRKECFGNREEIAFLEFIHGRSRDCPLVEVPDHGDLIDRETIVDSVCNGVCSCSVCSFNQCPFDSCVLQTNLEKLNVVIPADKEEV